MLAGHGSIWVVGCELVIGVDNVDVGWDRRRRRGDVWLETTASLFSHSDFVSQIGFWFNFLL